MNHKYFNLENTEEDGEDEDFIYQRSKYILANIYDIVGGGYKDIFINDEDTFKLINY